jgi:endo-1,4-beta-xylanase
MTPPSRLLLLLLPLLLLLTHPAPAAPADLLAPGGWGLSAPHPGDAALATAGDRCTVTVTKPSDPFYLIQLTRDIPRVLPEGRRVRLRFEARSETKNPLRATLERNGPPYDAAAVRTLALTPQWQTYTVEGIAPGYALNAHLQMGGQAGMVEMRGMVVTDEGMDPALAGAQAALQPAQIRARIEKYRKGTLSVRVVDGKGRPVPGASVRLAQTRHAFLFGCNFFGLNPADTSPAEKAYQTGFTGLFNYATLPFYWGAFEGTQGQPDHARLQGMAAWSVAHGVTVKGHPLVWHEVWPRWAPSDPDQAIPLLRARVADLVPRYKDTIHVWDVLNEANGAAEQTPPNGESNWIKRDGPAPVVETALGWAREAGKGLPETFLYNDYDTGESNVALLTQLQKDGKLPDAVGLQSHMHGGEWTLAKVWGVCQTFAQFGRPLHFTETTVLSGPRRDNPTNATLPDWNTTPEGEAKQAAYVAQFYTVLFSHPSVRAITWWDFSDKDAWQGAPAGLVRKDMSPKPAYTRLRDLIHHQWWTNATGKTDARGTLTRRVFYGDYTVTATDAQGRTVTRPLTFPEAAPPLSLTVRLP